jgi:hypothetical protein
MMMMKLMTMGMGMMKVKRMGTIARMPEGLDGRARSFVAQDVGFNEKNVARINSECQYL